MTLREHHLYNAENTKILSSVVHQSGGQGGREEQGWAELVRGAAAVVPDTKA